MFPQSAQAWMWFLPQSVQVGELVWPVFKWWEIGDLVCDWLPLISLKAIVDVYDYMYKTYLELRWLLNCEDYQKEVECQFTKFKDNLILQSKIKKIYISTFLNVKICCFYLSFMIENAIFALGLLALSRNGEIVTLAKGIPNIDNYQKSK